MPLYRTALRMAHDVTWAPRRRWTTTFFVQAASALAAATRVVTAWPTTLRNSTANTVFAYEVYATDLLATTADYAVVPISAGLQRGNGSTSGLGERYLPKACAAVDLLVPGSRPSRKFWRAGFYEADIVQGTSLTAAQASGIRGGFEAFLSALEGDLRDPDSEVVTAIGKIRLTTREFGRQATADVPEPPAVG